MKTIEVGQRPTTIWGQAKERLQGRSLVVHDKDGNKVKVRGVTTLRRSIVGPRLRTIYEPSDYGGTGDLAFAEVDQSLNDIVTRMGKQRKVRRIKEIEIPRFNTVATGIVIEQTGSHGRDPNNSIIYSNTAPRGGNHLGDIEWHGNDGQGFVFGILKSGVTVFAVDAGNALSFIKEDLVGLWKVDVSANGTQFRSRDTFPAALEILSGRRGRKLIKEWIDPATIPDRPKLVEDRKQQTAIFPVAYKDGYGNLKTTIRLHELPIDIKQTEVFYVQDANGNIVLVYNKLAGLEPKTGEFFLTYGSSGPEENPYIEINQMFGNAAKTLGLTEFTDHTTVTLGLKAPEEAAEVSDGIGTEPHLPRQLQQADTIAAAALDAKWFEHSISAEDIDTQRSIGIFSPKGELKGFATYEVLEGGTLPTDYAGNATYQGKVLFIQQFTTDTNYQVGNTQSDTLVLAAVEKKARELGCNEVWEALDKNHPFSQGNNPQHDAFGFYRSQGYTTDDTSELSWQPNDKISIPCTLFRKNLTQH